MDRFPRGGTLYERVQRIGVISWSLLGLILLLIGMIWLLARVRIILPPLVLAIIIIYLLNPVVDRFTAQGTNRILASCLSYVILIGILFLAGFLVLPAIRSQAEEFATRLPDIVDALGRQLSGLASRLGIRLGFTPSVAGIQEWWEDPNSRTVILSQIGRLTDVTLTLVEALLLLILAPILAFYLLIDLPQLQRSAVRLLPARLRVESVFLANKLSGAVGGFVRGQLVVALIVGLLSSVGLWIIRLPFWLVIGVLAGLLNLVPFLGPFAGGALAVMVALTTRDVGTALWAAAVMVVVQQIDNHFISPSVLRATVRLHPATIMLALLAGATLGGLLGVLVAVPVVASLKLLVVHFWRTRVLGEWEEATAEPVQPPPEAAQG